MTLPRKRFGQHFLTDHQVIQRLVDVIQPKAHDHLVEIGPGQGALTFPVLARSKHLLAIELDRDLIEPLRAHAKAYGELDIVQGDALRFDFGSLITPPQQLRVIGNLPYNISTPLIFHLLSFAERIQDMHFMLQKEVVDRLAATCRTKDYGRLSVMVQYHCKVTALFDVPPTAFNPPPKVDSSIVRLIPHTTLTCQAEDYQVFANLVQLAFNQRRKTMRNSLRTLVDDTIWDKVGIASTARAEELSVEDFVRLSNMVVMQASQ